jgi:hypothetical protein
MVGRLASLFRPREACWAQVGVVQVAQAALLAAEQRLDDLADINTCLAHLSGGWGVGLWVSVVREGGPCDVFACFM